MLYEETRRVRIRSAVPEDPRSALRDFAADEAPWWAYAFEGIAGPDGGVAEPQSYQSLHT